MLSVKIKLLEGGKLPVFKTIGAACADAYACLKEDVVIPPKKRTLIPLGFCVELPEGYEMQVRPRSGLTSKSVDDGWGTVDCDYRGEVKACVINNQEEDLVVSNGDRICQLAIRDVPKVFFQIVDELSETERGDNGFGSTGSK